MGALDDFIQKRQSSSEASGLDAFIDKRHPERKIAREEEEKRREEERKRQEEEQKQQSEQAKSKQDFDKKYQQNIVAGKSSLPLYKELWGKAKDVSADLGEGINKISDKAYQNLNPKKVSSYFKSQEEEVMRFNVGQGLSEKKFPTSLGDYSERDIAELTTKGSTMNAEQRQKIDTAPTSQTNTHVPFKRAMGKLMDNPFVGMETEYSTETINQQLDKRKEKLKSNLEELNNGKISKDEYKKKDKEIMEQYKDFEKQSGEKAFFFMLNFLSGGEANMLKQLFKNGEKDAMKSFLRGKLPNEVLDEATTAVLKKDSFKEADALLSEYVGLKAEKVIEKTVVPKLTDDIAESEGKSFDEFVETAIPKGENIFYHGTSASGAKNIDKVGFIKTKGGFNKGRGISVSSDVSVSDAFASGEVVGKSKGKEGSIFAVELKPNAKKIDAQEFLDIRNDLAKNMDLSWEEMTSSAKKMGYISAEQLSPAEITKLKFKKAGDDVYKLLEKQGVDMIDHSKRAYTVGAQQSESVILNPDAILSKTKIKTKSQLKQLWDKGNRQEAIKAVPELGQDSRVSSIRSTPLETVTQSKAPTQKKALELSERFDEDFSFEPTIAKSATNVKDKINIIDQLRTPDRVMKKIGMEKEMNLVRKQYDKYITELPKEIDKIDAWTSKMTKEENVNIFKHLDGEQVALSPKEQKIAGEIKGYLKEWADKLDLPEDNRISNYITHVFENDFGAKEFDEDLAKLINDNVAGSVYDPFTLKRLGAKGYVQDTRKALEAYVKRASRKVNMDVALEQVKKSADKLELSQYNYVKKFVDRINLRPTDIDNMIDNTVKSLVGYKFGQRPFATLSREMRKVIYRGALGLNVSSTLKNLSQGANTFAKLGAKYTTTGYAKLIKNWNSGELEKVGVLADNFIQDKTLSAGRKALQKADKVLFSLFETAERINRGSAYFGAKAKAINEGMSEVDAIAFGKKIVRDTQFTFGSIDTPPILQSDIGKTLGQFQSFSLKQAEFLTEMARNKEYAGLIRWTMASLGFVYGIGKSFGMGPEDLIPTLRIGVPPTAQVPVEATKALLGAPNKYGQPTGSNEILRAATPLVPAGTQAKKTYQGLKAYEQGYSGSASDRVRFPIEEGTGSKIKTGVFGQYSGSGAREYFDKNRKVLGSKQSQDFRDLPRGEQKAFYDKIMSDRKKRNPFYQN